MTAQRDPRLAIDTLLDYRCDAAILIGPLVREPWLSALGERLPTVVLGQSTRSQAVDVIRTSDAAGSPMPEADEVVDREPGAEHHFVAKLLSRTVDAVREVSMEWVVERQRHAEQP